MPFFPDLSPILDKLERFGFQQSFFLPIALGVLLLLFALLLWFLLRRKDRYSVLPPGYRTRSHYKAYRQAQRHEARGERAIAASLYAQAGLKERAIALYREVGEFGRSAELLKSMGRKREAAQDLIKARRYEEAGKILEELRLYSEAESAYLKGGFKGKALELWRRLEKWKELGELALKICDFPSFREALDASDSPRDLIDSAWKLFRREVEEGEGGLEPSEFWDPLLKELLERGEKEGIWEILWEVASYLGRWDLAARAGETLGRWEEARKLYERVGDQEGLARVLEKIGEVQASRLIRAELKEREGNLLEAARLYEEAGEPRRALLLWQIQERWEECARIEENLGEYESAARSYEKAGRFQEAMEIYGRLERWEEAGRCAEELKDYATAAQYYRRAGLWLKSARVMEKEGNLRVAITDLQHSLRVEGWDPEVARHLAFLMMGIGMAEAAIPLFERIVPTHPSNPRDAELTYQLAMLLENEGRIGEAVRYYERLLVFDINYRDVPERLRRLKESFTRSFPTPSPVETTPSHPQGGETRRLSERYEILEELGRGGMGIVFKARDQLLDRLVALKVVRLEDVTEGSRDRLLNEARVAAKLNHPNIVQIYDCAFARGFLTIAMEYVDGQSLREILAQKGPFPVPAALLVMGQVARALEYAHGMGIVHRDIKPANILWTPQKTAKLTDFGIARMIQDLKTTRTLVVGTPLYMAPEQITGRGVDHRVDLYALGVTFYELLTGAPPFPHGDVGYHHIHTPPPDPRTLRPDIPEPLVGVILRLLAKSPEERYSSAREFLQALKPIATSLAVKEQRSL